MLEARTVQAVLGHAPPSTTAIVPTCCPTASMYRPDFLTPADEQLLLAEIEALPLRGSAVSELHRQAADPELRRGYDFETNVLLPAPPLPTFLLRLRERVAEWVGIPAEEFT